MLKITKSLLQINQELDDMFSDHVKAPGKRTIRRKKRVEQKMLFEEKQEPIVSKPSEEQLNPAEYSMIKFAENYFNDHPKSASGTLTRTNKMLSASDIMPKSEMVSYTKNTSLPTSLIHMQDPENVTLACSIFKDIVKQLKGDLKPEQVVQSTQSIVAYCIERPELRDEVYCQLIRMATNNPKVRL